jgi:hypothetical protein
MLSATGLDGMQGQRRGTGSGVGQAGEVRIFHSQAKSAVGFIAACRCRLHSMYAPASPNPYVTFTSPKL